MNKKLIFGLLSIILICGGIIYFNACTKQNLTSVAKQSFVVDKKEFQDTLSMMVASYQEALQQSLQKQTREGGKIDLNALNQHAQLTMKMRYGIDPEKPTISWVTRSVDDTTVVLSDYAKSYYDYFANNVLEDKDVDNQLENATVEEITAFLNTKYLAFEEKIKNDHKLTDSEKNILLIQFETQRQMQDIENQIIEANNYETRGWLKNLWNKIIKPVVVAIVAVIIPMSLCMVGGSLLSLLTPPPFNAVALGSSIAGCLTGGIMLGIYVAPELYKKMIN